MISTPELVVYLDTSILIAWLKDEKRPGDEMDGVYECFERIQKGEIRAIVSSLYHAEIDIERYPTEKQRDFYRLLAGQNPLEVGIETRVCQLAGEVRRFCQERSKKLGMADALHLAAAIHHRASEFYVFDDAVENRRTDLVELSGSIAGRSLVIRKPPVSRPRLI
jgi:predicted nucleic acid-binding protein